MLAQEEARRLGHNYVGTEQILLGLLGDPKTIPYKVLLSQRVNRKDARIEVEKIVSRGKGAFAVEIPFTPRSKRVLELSWKSAKDLGHDYIGPEHLFLGLLAEGEGVAAKVLKNHGLNLADLRDATLAVIRGEVEVATDERPIEDDTRTPTVSVSPFNGNWIDCSNCGERIKNSLKVCVHCNYGISDEIYTDCRFCKERIRKGAIKCKHCHSMLNEE
jgi:ATP-dependent Clp protease ATP-binding subunit ClpC